MKKKKNARDELEKPLAHGECGGAGLMVGLDGLGDLFQP